MQDFMVKLVETEAERQGAFDLRVRVFVQEQGVPMEEELDEDDETATHAIALLDGKPIGTGRVLCMDSGHARIGRMAVERGWRRRGVGGGILLVLEEAARCRGMAESVLHAQTYVEGFYSSHGYVAEGNPFLEVGIEHVRMSKRL